MSQQKSMNMTLFNLQESYRNTISHTFL